MNASTGMTVSDYVDIVLRRKWLILGIFVSCVSIAVVLCEVLPKNYRSTTTILLESQKIPTSVVKTGVEGTADSRLNAIQQIVMSRTLLTKVAEQFALITPSMSALERETVVQRMRDQAKVTKMRMGHARGQDTTEGFTLSFQHKDPVIAMKVTESLASQFIEQDLKFREQMLEGTTGFLEQELRSAEVKLQEQERMISDFRTKHIGELPQQMEANLRSLDRLQLDVNGARENIQTTTSRVASLDQQIHEAATVSTQNATQSVSLSGSVSQGRVADPLLLRLAELERTLTVLSAEYRETYPDVVQTRREIEAVKGQLAARNGGKQADDSPAPAKMHEPVKIFDPMVIELKRQRNEANRELEVAKERYSRLLDQVRQLEGRVERIPVREQQLSSLVRDYDNMQKNYQSLLDKILNARLAENLEKRQKGEQFRVLDPANLPISPESPNVLYILLAGVAVGCGLGVGSAFAVELLKPSFQREEQVEGLLGVPILAGIPFFSTLRRLEEKIASASALRAERTKRSRLLEYPGREGTKGAIGPVLKEEPLLPAVSWNLVAKRWPNSMAAEQYRVAATRLALMAREHEHPIALITSSILGEGKSTTTLNLGYVFAQALDKKTLIVDCDFKRSSVSKYLGMPYSPGLSDYWKGTHQLEACIHQVDESPLWVLPTGLEGEQVFELSRIRQLEQLLDEMRPRFDQILLDAPPAFPLADLNFLSQLADVLVFVILAGKTSRDVVEKALKALRAQCPVGIILNGVESTSMPYYQNPYADHSDTHYVVKR